MDLRSKLNEEQKEKLQNESNFVLSFDFSFTTLEFCLDTIRLIVFLLHEKIFTKLNQAR